MERDTQRGLNPKQQRFVQEYLIDLNATQAAIRAGYAPRAAGQVAFKLLKNAQIQAAIEAGKKKLADSAEVTAERVIAEVSHIAFSDIGDVLDFDGDQLCMRLPSQIPRAARRAICSMKVKRSIGMDGSGNPVPVEVVEFKMHSKTTGLQQLIDHLGLKAPTKNEHSGSIQIESVDRRGELARKLASLAGRSNAGAVGSDSNAE